MKIPIQGVVLQGISDNNATFDTREAAVLDLSTLTEFISGQHIAGIVGLGTLAPETSRFDFAAKTLTFFSTLTRRSGFLAELSCRCVRVQALLLFVPPLRLTVLLIW